DLNGDGAVTNLDVQALIAHLANSGTGNLSAVDEPSSVILGCLGSLAILWNRFFRSCRVSVQ
ncbi:MAG TPA: hypothetical protein VGI75_07795, partial [Pirellulales bacterium]